MPNFGPRNGLVPEWIGCLIETRSDKLYDLLVSDKIRQTLQPSSVKGQDRDWMMFLYCLCIFHTIWKVFDTVFMFGFYSHVLFTEYPWYKQRTNIKRCLVTFKVSIDLKQKWFLLTPVNLINFYTNFCFFRIIHFCKVNSTLWNLIIVCVFFFSVFSSVSTFISVYLRKQEKKLIICLHLIQ